MSIKQIKDIYPGYFQKSKIFLYPMVVDRRDSANMPLETYLACESIGLKEPKFVVEFAENDTEEFKKFENEELFSSPYFDDMKVVDGKFLYIFDLSLVDEDYCHVLEGKYSKLSEETKVRIRKHFGAETANYAFIHSYLYPEEHIERYAGFLSPDDSDIPKMVEILTNLGELCSKPDYRKETLKLK